MNSKLLSLCIPTFNRCDVLHETLENLFSNPDFDEARIEVIVSDNCSTDRTNEVVANYPLVKYHRNSTNIHAYNFSVSLGYATGKYLKIMNDTFSFKPGALGWMLEIIELNSNEEKNLLFFPNFLHNRGTSIEISTIEEFFRQCSFYATWSASTGFWKKNFDDITDVEKYTELLFPQLHWMYSIVRNGKPTKIYFHDFYDVKVPQKKGGYNFCQTFVSDYLGIVKEQRINVVLYELEKYRLWKYHLYPWMSQMLTGNSRFEFRLDRCFHAFFVRYWYELYVYLGIFFLLLKVQFAKLKVSVK